MNSQTVQNNEVKSDKSKEQVDINSIKIENQNQALGIIIQIVRREFENQNMKLTLDEAALLHRAIHTFTIKDKEEKE
ncbi:hypothetical protein N9T73_00210, partial [bacterium]|nr:hypothetical protein [bacterium]